MTAEDRPGSLFHRVLEDGVTELTVYPMTFGKARLCIGLVGDGGYDDGWCYEDPLMAIRAAETWDGRGDPPVGWHRQISTGRRRPNGDPGYEYVSP
jgi:hypothetical protein